MGRKHIKAMMATLLIPALLALSHLYVQASQNDSLINPSVAIQSAVIFSTSHVEGESKICIAQDNAIHAELGVFTMPGAYAEIKVNVQNTGNKTVYLSGIEQISPISENFKMETPAFDTEKEMLALGEECSFTVVVYWDPESSASFLEKSILILILS